MRQIRTSGSMSGDGKRGDAFAATALVLDSTCGQNDPPPKCLLNNKLFGCPLVPRRFRAAGSTARPYGRNQSKMSF